jgi:hypothetical protein
VAYQARRRIDGQRALTTPPAPRSTAGDSESGTAIIAQQPPAGQGCAFRAVRCKQLMQCGFHTTVAPRLYKSSTSLYFVMSDYGTKECSCTRQTFSKQNLHDRKQNKNTSKSTEGAERARRRSGQHQGAQIITSNITGHWKHNPTTRWRVMTSPDTVRTLRRCAQLLLFYGDTVVSSRLLQYSILIVAHAAGRRPHIYEVVLSYYEVLLCSNHVAPPSRNGHSLRSRTMLKTDVCVFNAQWGTSHAEIAAMSLFTRGRVACCDSIDVADVPNTVHRGRDCNDVDQRAHKARGPHN